MTHTRRAPRNARDSDVRGHDTADEAVLRTAIVAAGRRLGARGLIVAAEGNLSVRLSDDSILVTPSGLRKDELREEDLLVVGARPGAAVPADRPHALRPTSDLRIHRAVYAARRDAAAVVHAHVPASMALTLAGRAPDPTALPETALHIPRLPVVAHGEMGSDDLAVRIAAALSEPPEPLPVAALLERHGAVALGTGVDPLHALDMAVERIELVDVLCRVWRDALLLGASPSER